MIEFKNLTKKRVERAIFKKLYKKIFLPAGKAGLKKFNLSVVFSTPLLMTTLNKKYRNKNKSADVLSFLLEKNEGEIFLNTGLPRRQAGLPRRRAGEKNLPYLFAHGAFHLLGYGHATKSQAELMQKKEKTLFKSLQS